LFLLFAIKKEEMKRFLLVIDDPHFKLLFMMLYYYGLRIGEARGLKHKDIDFKNKTVYIRRSLTNKLEGGKRTELSPKSSSSIREYPLLKIVSATYKEVFSGHPSKNEYLFSYGESTIARYNRKYSLEAGLKTIRLHDFRHSCASYLINNGMDYLQVSSWLGHKSPVTTLDVYSHLFPSRKKAIGDFIDKNM
jgi:integrase